MENNEALNGWKEIAGYLRLGIRTVQRYEKKFDLPVRRLAGKPRSLVFAMAHEIDNWRQTALVRRVAADLEPAKTAEPEQAADTKIADCA